MGAIGEKKYNTNSNSTLDQNLVVLSRDFK